MSRLSASTAALALAPGSGQTSLGPYCACNSCLVIFISPRRIWLCGSAASVRCPATDPKGMGWSSSVRPEDDIELERIFGRTDLIAAEEARSCEGREYAQVAPWAEAERARPRPAP